MEEVNNLGSHSFIRHSVAESSSTNANGFFKFLSCDIFTLVDTCSCCFLNTNPTCDDEEVHQHNFPNEQSSANFSSSAPQLFYTAHNNPMESSLVDQHKPVIESYNQAVLNQINGPLIEASNLPDQKHLTTKVQINNENILNDNVIVIPTGIAETLPTVTTEHIITTDTLNTKLSGIESIAEPAKELVTELVSKQKKVISSSAQTTCTHHPYLIPTINEQSKQIVYTDGSCIGSGTTKAKAGYGLFYGKDDSRNVSVRLRGRQHSLNAELEAVNHALRNAINECNKKAHVKHLEIRTDCMTVYYWITGKKRCRNSKFRAVVNQCKKKIILLNGMGIQISIKVIRGHSGIFGNEEADRLAKEGAGKVFIKIAS